ncbi:MAG: hypothetical protein PHV75_01655 [Victivallaceae bacterium]|nr:hypothetical protein [Victivallaceae bacterium]MDD4317202.1 hypothetical protein [Victivallaceae bacterium]MDD5664146.1 hypothetical protein [Victivallaceae bacterium]
MRGKKLVELNDKGLWHNRGLIYQATALRNQKKYDEALAMLPDDVIAQMHPHRQGEALIERGHIFRFNKKYPEAIGEYTKVYEL